MVILKSKKAVYYLITIIFMIQAYWVFIAISPILYMEDLGVSLQDFGLYQGAMAVAFSVINFSNSYLLKIFGKKKCFYFSILMQIIFIFATIILVLLNIKAPLLITLVTVLAATGMSIPCNILWPLALEAVPDSRGRIIALLSSGRLIVTALFVQLIGYLYRVVSLKNWGLLCLLALLWH